MVPFTKTEKTKNVTDIFHVSIFEVGNQEVGNQICLAVKRWRGYLATQLRMSNKWLNLRSQSRSRSEIDILRFITISVQWSLKVEKKNLRWFTRCQHEHCDMSASSLGSSQANGQNISFEM